MITDTDCSMPREPADDDTPRMLIEVPVPLRMRRISSEGVCAATSLRDCIEYCRSVFSSTAVIATGISRTDSS